MMKKNSFPYFIVGSLLVVLAFLFLLHLDVSLPVLHPKGWVGIQQRDLIVKTSFVMLLVVLPVLVLTVYFGWKYRAGKEKSLHQPEWDQSHLLEVIWWTVPFCIITVLAIWTWKSSHELDPYRPLASEVKPLSIQVVALDWKWLFLYPEQKIATINELYVPEKVPLEFIITADAPMNSFWIPALGGQIYAMAGMKTKLFLIADKPGTYRGQSANISGDGFAGMTFLTTAIEQEGFEKWVGKVRQQGTSLDFMEYKNLSRPSSYEPIHYYQLEEPALFDKIIEQFVSKMAKGGS